MQWQYQKESDLVDPAEEIAECADEADEWVDTRSDDLGLYSNHCARVLAGSVHEYAGENGFDVGAIADWAIDHQRDPLTAIAKHTERDRAEVVAEWRKWLAALPPPFEAFAPELLPRSPEEPLEPAVDAVRGADRSRDARLAHPPQFAMSDRCSVTIRTGELHARRRPCQRSSARVRRTRLGTRAGGARGRARLVGRLDHRRRLGAERDTVVDACKAWPVATYPVA